MFAGAAFTDSADIKATDAVNMLSSLGVITGYTDGSYQPNKVVTRAEMAKMIFVVRNNKIDDSAYQSNYSKLTDISNHWAKGYIKFCESQGIIAGKGNNKFDPDSPVTGVEAAKMLLVVSGYDSDKAGLTGSAWRTNVLKYAGAAGILDDVNSALEQGLPRQYAAQMIYNTLDVNRVKWSKDSESFDDVLNGGVKETVGHAYMGLTKSTGTLVTVKKDTLALDTNTIDGAESDAISTSTKNGVVSYKYADKFTKVSEDYTSLLGQKVKVLHEKNKTDKVFGVYADPDSKVVATAICDDLDTVSSSNEKIKVDGTEYKTDGALSSVQVFNFNQSAVAGKLASYIDNADVAPYSIKLIDNDDNGKIDRAVVTPFKVNEVTYVGSTSLTLKGIGSVDKDDIILSDDVKKDDYVKVIAAANSVKEKRVASKVDVVTGTVESVKDSSTVKVDGNWYKKAGSDALSDADLDSKVELQVVNGFYFAAEVVAADAGSSDVLYISAADDADSDVGDWSVSAKAYFADGSDKKITIVEVNDKDVKGDSTVAMQQKSREDSTLVPQVDSYLTTNNKVVVGMMYRYETKKNGDYKLFALDDSNSKNRAGYKTYKQASTGKYTDSTDRLTVDSTSFTIADDATVYVQTTNAAATGDKVKVITGKALKKWADTTGLYAQVLANETNGAKNAKVVSIVYNAASISSASDDSYGFVTATPVRVTNTDGDKVWQYEIWNGSKKVTVFEDSSTAHAEKGHFVKYNVVSDNEIEDLKDLNTTNVGSYAAVTVVDGKKIDVKLAGGTTVKSALEIDSEDTNVVYVNTKDTKGVEGGSVAEADEPTTGNYTMNVYIVGYANDGDTIDALFVDVNNKMEDDNLKYSAAVGADTTVIADGVTYTLTVETASVAEGKAITVKVAPSTAVTAEAGAKIVVKCNETGKTQTISFAKGDSAAKTATFAQEAYATTYSIVK